MTTRRKPRPSRPIIIGVTGHRNLDARDNLLHRLVTHELKRLKRANGNAPLLVLSGLAEGADRLVVDAARNIGEMYIAVLPLPDPLYERDFSGVASRAEYARLCSSALRIVRAPLMASRRDIAEYGEPRNCQYAWTGAYIAKRAQVLIALWDGAPARGTGGTAQVVEWFLANKTPGQYRISHAARLVGRSEVDAEFIHLDPGAKKTRRTLRKG